MNNYSKLLVALLLATTFSCQADDALCSFPGALNQDKLHCQIIEQDNVVTLSGWETKGWAFTCPPGKFYLNKYKNLSDADVSAAPNLFVQSDNLFNLIFTNWAISTNEKVSIQYSCGDEPVKYDNIHIG